MLQKLYRFKITLVTKGTSYNEQFVRFVFMKSCAVI
jgi:hypothetical protein